MPCGGNTPTRINHQLVYGPSTGNGLCASVNVSLNNPNVFVAKGKTGFAWGQAPVGDTVESTLGLVGNVSEGTNCAIDLTFYDEQGELGTRRFELKDGAAVRFDPAEALSWRADGGQPVDNLSYLW